MSLDSATEAFRAGRFQQAYEALVALQADPAGRVDREALALLRELNRNGCRTGVRSRCLHRFSSQDEAPVVALRFTPCGLCLSGTTRGALEIWDIVAGKRLNQLTGHRGRITTIAVANAAPVVVSVDERRHLRVWDIESMTPRVHLDHSDYDDDVFQVVAVSHDGTRGFSTDGVAQCYQWNLEKGRLMRTFDLVTSGAPIRAIFSPTQRNTICLEHQDGSWARLEMNTDHIEATPAPEVVFNSIYRTVVVDERVILRNPATGEDLLVLNGHEEPVLSAAVSHGEVLVLSGDAGGEIRVWEVDWDLEFD